MKNQEQRYNKFIEDSKYRYGQKKVYKALSNEEKHERYKTIKCSDENGRVHNVKPDVAETLISRGELHKVKG